MRSALRFSLLEMLALLLVPGLAIAALRAGGIFVSLTLLSGMACVMTFAVAALFGSGSVRAFAGGFVVVAGIYGGLLLYFGKSELTGDGLMPTTRLLSPLQEAMAPTKYENWRTGEFVSKAEFEAYMAGRTPQQGSTIREIQPPEATDFMLISHLLIGASLGYLGGKLAVLFRGRSDGGQAATDSQVGLR